VFWKNPAELAGFFPYTAAHGRFLSNATGIVDEFFRLLLPQKRTSQITAPLRDIFGY
jgi:hypothetical protein